MWAASHTRLDNNTTTAQVLVHRCGLLCRVPDTQALADHLARRLPARVWTRTADDTIVVLSPWSWTVFATIAAAWPAMQVAPIASLHAPQPAGRRAA
jgi:hypothetical protein